MARVGQEVTKAAEYAKSAALLAVMIYLMLMVEYTDNCTRYRAFWCDFLDLTMSWVPQ